MTSSERFLDRFLSRSARGEALEAILDEPDGFAAAAAGPDPRFDAAWRRAAEIAPPPQPIVAPDGLATAVLDPRGRVREADARFVAWFGEGGVAAGDVRRALAGEVVRARISVGDGESVLALADAAAAVDWPLAAPVREALQREPGLVAAIGVTPSRAEGLRAEAMRAFGLSALEARIAVALVEHGRLPLAARRGGVAYATAREALDRAMRKAGVRRQAELVARLLAISLGAWTPPADPAGVVADAFGLTSRQARLAVLVAAGAARAEAARAAGVSNSVAKDELARVFEIMGVVSVAALSRLVTETTALSVLTGVTGAALAGPSDRAEPLRLVPRPGGGWIAVSDHGPPDGAPVLVLHATATSRHLPRSLVCALQAADYRPLAVDRPGFGLTDPAPGDIFEAAAHDLVTVCEALRLAPVRLLLRGGARCAWRFQALAPERVRRIVGLNANLGAPPSGRGLLPSFGGLLARDPATTAAIARFFAGRAHSGAVERLLHRSIAASPADRAVFADRAQVEDYLRSVRFLASGRFDGMIAEQIALACATNLPPTPDAACWRLIVCPNDPLFDADAVLASALALLPGAEVIRLEGAGRFPHLSHTAAVVAALA